MLLQYHDDFEVVDLGIQEEDVYDIEVADVHNFFANDILVHNSCYFSLAAVVDKYIAKKATKDGKLNITAVIDAMDKIVNEKVTPAINAACNDIARYTNSYSQRMNFKREALSDRGVFLAKKKYALNVYDNEGVRYAEPKTKVMGIEVVRSSTPAPVRKMLKSAIDIVLTGSERELQDFVKATEKEFFALSAEEIAFPRGANNLVKYSHPTDVFQQGCPIQVRAALLYNAMLDKYGLTDRYEVISDGDKIKYIYLREPNSLRQNCVGFVDQLPSEFGLHKYIDYQMAWEKAFMTPLKSITDAIGWSPVKKNTLAALFG